MSSSTSTLCGNSLENLEGTSIWSPTALNSSGSSYPSGSPTLRSFETNIWSPSFNSSSSTSFSSGSGSPTEQKPSVGLGSNHGGSMMWSSKSSSNNGYNNGLTLPQRNSASGSCNNALLGNHNNGSSILGRVNNETPPPNRGNSQFGQLGGLNSSPLDLKQTIQALSVRK